jgi:hypothetical protein
MRRMLLLGSIAVSVGTALPAVAGSELPAAAVSECERLLGTDAIRYVLRQIDLTAEQAVFAEGLIETMFSGDGLPPNINLDEVRDLWKRLDRAKEIRNQEKIERFSNELRQMGLDLTGYEEFYSNLGPQLTENQKERLERARKRLERDPDGAVRPGDLIMIVRDFDLTDEQREKLIRVAHSTNKVLGFTLQPKPKLRLKLTNACADSIRPILTPEQLAEFEFRVRTMRPDLIGEGLRVKMPPPDEPSSEQESASDDD